MIIDISSDAEADLIDGFWFYERQAPGLGNYFRSCLISDIESLEYYAGIHSKEYGYYRALAKRFPFGIFYSCDSERVLVVAILDLRSKPLWVRHRLGG